MAKFHIIITNNETGEIEFERDTNAIIAGVDVGDRVTGVCRTACDDNTLAATCFAARKRPSTTAWKTSPQCRDCSRNTSRNTKKKQENAENLTEKEIYQL